MLAMDETDAKAGLGPGSASDEEASAAIAALEMLLRETARVQTPAPRELDRWRSTALLEGVRRDSSGDEREPWIKA